MRRSAWAAAAAAAWSIAAFAQGERFATRAGGELGVQAATYEYDEPNFAFLEGERVGISGAYTFPGRDEVHSRIEGRYSYAELDYTGSGTIAGAPDYLVEVRALLGQDLRAGGLLWVPYVGIGLRYLYSDLRGVSSTGENGYRRRSRYLYAPIGVTLRIPLGLRWTLAPELEYDFFVDGRQRSYLQDADPALPNVTNTQSRGRGARARLGLETGRWSLSLWTHYWKIKNSDVQPIGPGVGLLEPANSTQETGVELRYRF